MTCRHDMIIHTHDEYVPVSVQGGWRTPCNVVEAYRSQCSTVKYVLAVLGQQYKCSGNGNA